MRAVADISAVAAPGALVYISNVQGTKGGGWYPAEGTSLSSPVHRGGHRIGRRGQQLFRVPSLPACTHDPPGVSRYSQRRDQRLPQAADLCRPSRLRRADRPRQPSRASGVLPCRRHDRSEASFCHARGAARPGSGESELDRVSGPAEPEPVHRPDDDHVAVVSAASLRRSPAEDRLRHRSRVALAPRRQDDQTEHLAALPRPAGTAPRRARAGYGRLARPTGSLGHGHEPGAPARSLTSFSPRTPRKRYDRRGRR